MYLIIDKWGQDWNFNYEFTTFFGTVRCLRRWKMWMGVSGGVTSWYYPRLPIPQKGALFKILRTKGAWLSRWFVQTKFIRRCSGIWIRHPTKVERALYHYLINHVLRWISLSFANPCLYTLIVTKYAQIDKIDYQSREINLLIVDLNFDSVDIVYM